VIGRQAGIEYRGGHKQSLVCFPTPQFYARQRKPRNVPWPLNQVRLLLRLGFALCFRKRIHLRRRIDTRIAAQQALNREKLDFWIILVVPELRFVTARLNRFVGFSSVMKAPAVISALLREYP
jgi:hypothetical protein